jgi:hypothetical protein
MFAFANPAIFPEFTQRNESAQQNGKQFSFHAPHGRELLLNISWGFVTTQRRRLRKQYTPPGGRANRLPGGVHQ